VLSRLDTITVFPATQYVTSKPTIERAVVEIKHELSEQVKKFEILPQDLSQEGGELTPAGERFLARIEEADKNWKFSVHDANERAFWSDYMAAYEDALSETSTKDAPWYVIPADHKWFAHAAIAEILHDTLKRLDPQFPTLTAAQRRELANARREITRKHKAGRCPAVRSGRFFFLLLPASISPERRSTRRE